MATKISWNEFDYAAQQVLDSIMSEVDFSYREMENLTHGEVTYNRIRDIRLGRRAPVRLSEFILLCLINHHTPATALQKVFDKVRSNQQAEYDTYKDDFEYPEQDSINRFESDPLSQDYYDAVANMNDDKDLEAETPDD